VTILGLDTSSNFSSVAIRVNGEILSEITLESNEGFAHLIFPAIETCKNEARMAVGVSNLRALSLFARKPESLRAVVLDARRGEVYAGVYNHDLECVSPEVVTKLSDWLAHLDSSQQYEFISFRELDLQSTPFAGATLTVGEPFLAGAVTLCAEKDVTHGKWLDPAAVDANYVRRSDAELFWRES
jgi:tRNA threonylcarbamoyladenosine biosynthesis protein TsaB